jgi:ketosteroid isomerase-like protein
MRVATSSVHKARNADLPEDDIVRAKILALAALPLLAACGAADPREVLDTVRATEQAQLEAMAAKDLRGATRNYDPAAVVLTPGGAPVRGTAAIGRSYEALLADPNFAIAMKAGDGWAAESGELAITTATGTVVTTDAASGAPVTLPIVNQTVWRREDGVGWKIVSEHNAELPAAEGSAG